MDSPPGVVSPEAPPTQTTADQDTAPTQDPSPPRTHTQAASTPESTTAAQGTSTHDFATQAPAPHAPSIQRIPPSTTPSQIPSPQSSTHTPAQYIPSRPSSTVHLSSSARPSTTAQSAQFYSPQVSAETDEITPIPQLGESSTQLQDVATVNSQPRRYPLPPRPASFKGRDQCWEMLHDPTVPVLYIPPVERDGGWVERMRRGCWEWVKSCFLFRD